MSIVLEIKLHSMVFTTSTVLVVGVTCLSVIAGVFGAVGTPLLSSVCHSSSVWWAEGVVWV